MEREINIRRPIKPDIPSFKRVAAYVRVSNLKDAMLQSLSTQVSYYNDFIQRHAGWQYAGVYVDEGLTGTKDLRPEFQRLLADCRGGKIDMIITKSTTRFARNTVTMLETVRMLKEFDVDVFFEKENIHSMSGDGELMLSILASFAQEESRSISENYVLGQRKLFADGKVTVPFGRFLVYDKGPDGNLIVNEEQAMVVRRMHWLLDVHYSEDYCRIANKTAQQNLNLLRKFALSLLKLYKVEPVQAFL